MNEELEINVRKLRPFTRFIYTIGELPTSYLMSMTYEEQLIWFCNYLEKTVIPAINNNGEAVEELQAKYIELKDYVDNYFNNLDVQEEINNKLDEMADSGELENIISEYIQLQTTYTYNSVSEMKLATNLVNGSFARTNGFYSNNDDGASLYKVRTITNDDTVDEKTIIALYDNSLIAELVIEKVMSVKQFGAKGDNETDDTLSIQTALNNCKNVLINNGVYLIDVDDKLNVKSNQKVEMINSKLVAIPTDNGNSWQNATAIINIDDIDNFTLDGNNSIIEGERSNHENTTDQFGFGILINNSSTNIIIKNVTVKDCTGDGIMVWNGENKDIVIDNVISDNNHRQGISLVGCNNILISKSKFINTNGTNPQAGIDIEPDSNNYCNNIKIVDCLIDNNNGDGIQITNYSGTLVSPQIDYINDLLIDKCIITNNDGVGGINVTLLGITHNGNYIFSNNIINNNVRGMRIVSNYIQCVNNIIQNNSNDGIYFNSATNNSLHNNTVNKNGRYGIGIEDNSSYNIISNNLISLNNEDGILMYAGTGTTVTYNNISCNKIFNNSQSNNGTNSNINIQDRCNYNFISNNNFNCNSSSANYDILTSSQGTFNIITNNICKSGTGGAISLNGSNYTLMNIVDNVLEKGNLYT